MKLPSDLQVLLVEDNLEFAEMVRAMLGYMGVAPQHVPNGEAAVAYLTEQRPDVVLLDLNLGGMSGWQVMEFVHERYGAAVRVIITTAFSDPANRVMGKLQEIDRYLVKPFTPQQLHDAIQQVIAKDKPE